VTFDDYVGALAVPHRATQAYWHLVLSGAPALPAVRRGLKSENADVRMHCARLLDHLVDEASWPELVGMLDDPDPRVRVHAVHALACDRCKDNSCRADKADVMPKAIRLLATDPDHQVRGYAVGLVGRWVHDDDGVAAAALVAAHEHDPHPSVRKSAGWFAPGGTIYEKTRPKATR
jgi:HEAT repeat protein